MNAFNDVHSWAFGGKGYIIVKYPVNFVRCSPHGLFDSTLGYPGEGPTPRKWFAMIAAYLTIVTWNTRSLSDVRFKYCAKLGYDILALTELWDNAHRYADGTVRWTYSQKEIDPKINEPVFPNDPAAGVGILLSKRMIPKYREHGSPCNRICWVRLKGPVTNLFVIAVYLPHRARVKPARVCVVLYMCSCAVCMCCVCVCVCVLCVCVVLCMRCMYVLCVCAACMCCVCAVYVLCVCAACICCTVCCVYVLRVCAVCTCCVYMLCVCAVCICCVYVLRVCAACMCCVYVLCVCAVCVLCVCVVCMCCVHVLCACVVCV